MFLSQISVDNNMQVQKEGPCGTPSHLLTEVGQSAVPGYPIFFLLQH